MWYYLQVRTATASLPGQKLTAASSDASPLRPGTRLGAYELLTPLASGGMGHVWSAVRIGDFGFRRTAAIKVMREELASEPGFRRMFLDEARLAARISHSNVVEVLDLGEGEGGILFQAMALVDGDSLSRLALRSAERNEAVPPSVAARIASDVLRGLHAAHELRGDDGTLLEFVHHDVSPQNILVGLDGVAKITDFGVAKAAGAASKGKSQSGPRGKLAYMAPEQIVGEDVDRRTDIFAAGVVVWEMLTGRRLTREAAGLASAPIPHPTDVNGEAHRALGDVVMRALAHDRAARFATAEAMADALESAAHEAGIVLSQRSVAAWVSDLAGATIEKKRLDTEAQLARTVAGTAWAAPDATTQTEPTRADALASPTRTWARRIAAVAAAAALTLGVRSILVRGDAAPPSAGATASSIAPPIAPSMASPMAPSMASSMAPSVMEEVAVAPSSSALPRRPRSSPRPSVPAKASGAHPSAPKPMYESPYEAPTP